MVKFSCANRPPCHAKEPPPAEAALSLDTDFTPDTTLVGFSNWWFLAPQGGLISPQVSFCCPIKQFSNRKYTVVLNKRVGGP